MPLSTYEDQELASAVSPSTASETGLSAAHTHRFWVSSCLCFPTCCRNYRQTHAASHVYVASTLAAEPSPQSGSANSQLNHPFLSVPTQSRKLPPTKALKAPHDSVLRHHSDLFSQPCPSCHHSITPVTPVFLEQVDIPASGQRTAALFLGCFSIFLLPGLCWDTAVQVELLGAVRC